MHDGIELEKRGVPTAVICTDIFVTTARAQAAICGLADYPFVVIPHPISSLDATGLKERAETALPQVLKLVLKK